MLGQARLLEHSVCSVARQDFVVHREVDATYRRVPNIVVTSTVAYKLAASLSQQPDQLGCKALSHGESGYRQIGGGESPG